MEDKKTTLFENGLIWFGAAVSIAEILTGTYFAPLGFTKGSIAIIIGHIIGGILMFLAGIIGGKTDKSSMETVKLSFGRTGGAVFAVFNVIQLVGWTAIMIFDGAIAACEIWNIGYQLWSIIIGGLIILWIVVGITNLKKLNVLAMMSLFILTFVISIFIFKANNIKTKFADMISFGAAVELAVAMPLSWLPLIRDYTKDAKQPVKASAVSATTYGITSCWMYVIGMAAAIFTRESDIAQIIVSLGMGSIGLFVIVLSTVTTTFLDAYSAGVSSKSIFTGINIKLMAVVTTVIGVISAMFFPINNITDFLYFIGSVFAPMIAVQIADFFVMKGDNSNKKINGLNMSIWLVGFIIYRLLMKIDIPVGNTLPDMIITFLLVVIANKIKDKVNKSSVKLS